MAEFHYRLRQAVADLDLGCHLWTVAPESSKCCALNGTPAFKGVCARSQPLVQIPPLPFWLEDRQKENMRLTGSGREGIKTICWSLGF